MSFVVSVPVSGAAGWQFLKATQDRQLAALSSTPSVQRDIDYFRETVNSVESVSDFVEDSRLMRIALGAFGLDEDVQNVAFVEKIITDGSEDEAALANKLADKTYLEFAKIFSNEKLSTTDDFDEQQIQNIVDDFLDAQFEASVGASDDNLRVALYLERELNDLALLGGSEDTLYYRILGDPPMRLAFETAFGLPEGFSSIDIDQQVDVLKDSVSERFGSSGLDQFQDAAKTEELIQLYLARASVQISNLGDIGAQTALKILTS